MKLSITLMVIGAILLVEGGSRITVGILAGSAPLIIGGILTGLILGGYLLFRGIKRYKGISQHKEASTDDSLEESAVTVKMSEFLDLTEDEKRHVLEHYKAEGGMSKATKDKGVCSQCKGDADIGDYCFGCRKFICSDCFEREPHYSDCLAKKI